MAEAMTSFKPEYWAEEILTDLKTITGMRTHSSYEFNVPIHKGKILHIAKAGDTQIRDYVQHQNITFDPTDGTKIDLVIDQQRYFGKEYDDIDTYQALARALETDKRETTEALAQDADEFVSAKLYKAVADGKVAKNASAITPSGKNTLQAIEDGLVYLYSKNVAPSTRIWGEISPKFYSEFRIYLTELSTNNPDLLKKGAIGAYANVDVCIENLLPISNKVKYNFMRTGRALAYAEQIEKVQVVDKEEGFAKRFKGLMVYGAEVIRENEIYAIQETTTEADSTFLSRVK